MKEILGAYFMASAFSDVYADLDNVGNSKPLKRGKYKEVKPRSTVNRNDTCPCGSGLKYKRCCWRKNL